jgi:hypothetical protein
MPVRILFVGIGRKIEKDTLVLQDRINQFEGELEGQGMQIHNITLSAPTNANGVIALFSLVHYGPKTGEKQSTNGVKE